MATLSEVLKRNLRRLRARYSNQEEMAAALELSQGQVSNYLNGKGLSQISRLSERLEAAGVSSMELIHVAGQVNMEGLSDSETVVMTELCRTIALMKGRHRQKLVQALMADARLWADLQDVPLNEEALRLVSSLD